MVKMVECANFAEPSDAELAAQFLQGHGLNAFAGSHYHGESSHSVHDRIADTPVFVSEAEFEDAQALFRRVVAGDFSEANPDSSGRAGLGAALALRLAASPDVEKLTWLQKKAPLIVIVGAGFTVLFGALWRGIFG